MTRPLPHADEAVVIARVGGAAAGGDPELLKAALATAEETLDPDDVEELLLQTHLFAGFPRAIEALRAWDGRRRGTGRPRGRRPSEPSAPDEWRRRGEALFRRIYGDEYDALRMRLERIHPELAEWTLVDGYGKVLGRPGPDAARRSLAAVGALVALGAERQLVSHLQGARNVGVEVATLAAAARAVAAEWNHTELVARLLQKIVESQ